MGCHCTASATMRQVVMVRQGLCGGALDARTQASLGGDGVDLMNAVLGHQRHGAGGIGRPQGGAKGLQRQQRQVQSQPVHGGGGVEHGC